MGVRLSVIGLNHDLKQRRAFVVIRWVDEPEKSVSLPCPFETTRDNVLEAAREAVAVLHRELGTAELVLP